MHASDGRNRLGVVQPRQRSGDDARLAAPSDMDATSPLSLGSRPTVPLVGIPLGSTEVATPSISPAAPLSAAGSTLGNTGCSRFTNLSQSAGAPFDGGGLSGGTSVSCASTKGLDIPGPVTLRPSIGRAGIPLGSTELGGAGLKPGDPGSCPAGLPRRVVPTKCGSPLSGRQRLFVGNRRFQRLLN